MRRPLFTLVLLACVAALLGACTPGRNADELAAPRSRDEWTGLVAEIRLFERRMGFEPTRNFLTFAAERGGFPFCGYVSRRYLPYSYEDPAIRWLEASTHEECRDAVEDADVLFSETEAVGESDSPVTPSMLAAPLDRLLYLVIHEDCHDQFALPYGIEEAVCNVLTFRAMERFADEKYAAMPLELAGIRRFVREGALHSHATVSLYQRLAELYSRHERGGMSAPALLRERERLFRRAERELVWPKGTMNNLWIANSMTYSRHYAFFDKVHNALGGDLVHTVAFLRQVDAAKPAPAAVMAKHGMATEKSVEFVRAYEASIVEAAEQALATLRPAKPGGI